MFVWFFACLLMLRLCFVRHRSTTSLKLLRPRDIHFSFSSAYPTPKIRRSIGAQYLLANFVRNSSKNKMACVPC
jgi:hypothetical protein